MKKILIITNQFIPHCSSIGGVIRVLSYAKFFTDRGAKVIIISQKNQFYNYFGYKDYLSNISNILIPFNKNSTSVKIKQNYKKKNLLVKKIISFLKNILSCYGIDVASENYNQYKNLVNENISKHKFNNVIISGPPFSIFKLCLFIRKKYKNINIILDYRDSWNLRFNLNLFNFLSTNILEKKVVNNVDHITCATSKIKEKLDKKFCISHKTKLMANGFEIEMKKKFKQINYKYKNTIVIGYFGLIDNNENSYRDIKILKYFESLNQSNMNFKFKFYGNNNIDFNKPKNYEFYDAIDHSRALLEMSKMDYLLTIHTDKKTVEEVVTGKFYDYISTQKKIIVLTTGKSEAGRLVKKYKLGFEIDTLDNKEKNLKTMREILSSKKSINKNTDIFSRKYQNQIIYSLLV